MKYALVFNDDPLTHVTVLHDVLGKLRPRLDCLIAVPGIKNPERRKSYERAVLRIVGPRYVARTLWRFAAARFWSFERLARHHDIPFFRFSSVNAPEFRACFAQRGITSALSFTAELYKRETLNSGVRFYNLHGSILPGNKGLLPFFWAFLNDTPQGVTIHQIDERIDHGAVVLQSLLHSPKGPSLPALTDALLGELPALFARTMDHLDAGLPPALLDLKIDDSYGPIPTSDDIRRYFAKLHQSR